MNTCFVFLLRARTFRPAVTSDLVHRLAFGTSKFYLAPYSKTNQGLINDVKLGLRPDFISQLDQQARGVFYRKAQCNFLVFLMLICVLNSS